MSSPWLAKRTNYYEHLPPTTKAQVLVVNRCISFLFLLLIPLGRSRLLRGSIRSLLGFPCSLTLKTSPGTSLACLGLLLKGLFFHLLRASCREWFQCKTRLFLNWLPLAKHVERVVNVLVNLSGVAHLFQQTTQDASAAHPQDLEWQTSIGSTAALTSTYIIQKNST